MPMSFPPRIQFFFQTALVFTLLLVLPGLARSDLARWVIDDEHFAVAFLVDHIGYARVLGMFLRAEGHFLFDPETMEMGGGEWIIHTNSVFTNHEKRDEHLRGSDFLNVEQFPRMVFVPQRFEPAGDGWGQLAGTLELLGRTRPVTLEVRINKVARYPFPLGGLFSRPEVLGASVRGTIRRSEWGMTYGLSRDLVGDAIELIIEFEARRR
jgi:polyisoprenoid-binding protein YceI